MKIVALGTVAAALVVATAGANVAQAATVPIDSAILNGGASFIAGGSRIMFDPNIAGETATFTLPSIPGTQYSIQVTGQNNQSSSFFQFLVDRDGPGPSGFVQLGNNVNFGNGFNTITLATFTDLGTSDFSDRQRRYRQQRGADFWPLDHGSAASSRSPAFRSWGWRIGSARPAQEAESTGDRLNPSLEV
jgi:hypothetical protein